MKRGRRRAEIRKVSNATPQERRGHGFNMRCTEGNNSIENAMILVSMASSGLKRGTFSEVGEGGEEEKETL